MHNSGVGRLNANGWQRKAGYVVAVIVVLLIWIGVPEFNKWRADRIVDALCAKDGGDEIYEVIKLPPDEFNINWLVNLGGVESERTGSKYYYSTSTTDIQGSHNGADISRLVIWRTDATIVRATDKKVMAKLVSYVRRGGDPIGPWHPSHYQCPKQGFTHKVFIKAN